MIVIFSKTRVFALDPVHGGLFGFFRLGKASKKKNGKKAARLTAWVDPPPPIGQENVKNSRQVVIFGVILPFYKGQNGSKFSQNRSGQENVKKS